MKTALWAFYITLACLVIDLVVFAWSITYRSKMAPFWGLATVSAALWLSIHGKRIRALQEEALKKGKS